MQKFKAVFENQTFTDIDEASKASGISAGTLRGRWYRGKREKSGLFDEPRKQQRSKAVSLSYKGQYFNTLSDLADAVNLPRILVHTRWNRGKRIETGLLEPKQKHGYKLLDDSSRKIQIKYNGTVFEDFNQLSKATGIGASTLRNRWYQGKREDTGLFNQPRVRNRDKEISVHIGHKTFKTIGELSDYSELPADLLYSRWVRGKRVDNGLLKPKRGTKKAEDKKELVKAD